MVCVCGPVQVRKVICEWLAWILRMSRPGKSLSRRYLQRKARMRELTAKSPPSMSQESAFYEPHIKREGRRQRHSTQQLQVHARRSLTASIVVCTSFALIK